MDALLYLISKNKLNIYDIPIAELLSQYLQYLSDLNSMDLEVTSEFLEMASRLVQIKSSMLLPRYDDDEGQDPRDELMTELIGYQTCKAMARALTARNSGFDCFVRAPQAIEPDRSYRCIHEPQALVIAYSALAGKIKRRRPPSAEAFQGVVGRKMVSVGSRVVFILRSLLRGGRKSFASLFEQATGRSEAVATFLALLELIKSHRVVLEGEGGEGLVKPLRKSMRNSDPEQQSLLKE